MGRRSLSVSSLMVALLVPSVAWANHHLLKVYEIYGGSAANPQAQFIELRFYAAGQNILTGHSVRVYDATGGLAGTFTFTSNPANGADQARVLLATSQAQTLFNITPDLLMGSAAMSRAAGKACFESSSNGMIDCVAWGSYTGAAGAGDSAFGTPFAGGLPDNQSILRRTGADSVLQDADDTDNSNADFATAVPGPGNNAGMTGMLPASDCGNSVVDAGEDCDDGNTVDTDACRNNCMDAACGDGVRRTDIAAGNAGHEACDDGNGVDTDDCRNTCVAKACGDGIVSTGESCEPPNTATCSAACLFISSGNCGNGVVDASETCDDGNSDQTDSCRNCRLPMCGDGLVDAFEDCDDGNDDNGDGCENDCSVSPGGGAPEGTAEEEGGCASAGAGWLAAVLVVGLGVRRWRRRPRTGDRESEIENRRAGTGGREPVT